MEKYLFPYRNEIEFSAFNKTSILDQGILLWKCLHLIIHNYRKKFEEDWVFVKHEDLSRDPSNNFRILFKKLNLEFTPGVDEKIYNSTTSSHKEFLKRDAIKNIKLWKEKLEPKEIRLIKDGTSEIWPHFYEEKDW